MARKSLWRPGRRFNFATRQQAAWFGNGIFRQNREDACCASVPMAEFSQSPAVRKLRSGTRQDGRLVRALKGHTSPLRSVSFLNNSQLASDDVEGTIRFWNVDTGEQLKSAMALSGSTSTISPNGQTIAVAVPGGSVRVTPIRELSPAK